MSEEERKAERDRLWEEGLKKKEKKSKVPKDGVNNLDSPMGNKSNKDRSSASWHSKNKQKRTGD